MDDSKPTMAGLIRRSSLGSPGAVRLRAMTPPGVARRILAAARGQAPSISRAAASAASTCAWPSGPHLKHRPVS